MIYALNASPIRYLGEFELFSIGGEFIVHTPDGQELHFPDIDEAQNRMLRLFYQDVATRGSHSHLIASGAHQ